MLGGLGTGNRLTSKKIKKNWKDWKFRSLINKESFLPALKAREITIRKIKQVQLSRVKTIKYLVSPPWKKIQSPHQFGHLGRLTWKRGGRNCALFHRRRRMGCSEIQRLWGWGGSVLYRRRLRGRRPHWTAVGCRRPTEPSKRIGIETKHFRTGKNRA